MNRPCVLAAAVLVARLAEQRPERLDVALAAPHAARHAESFAVSARNIRATARCTLASGTFRALIRVERDTVIPYVPPAEPAKLRHQMPDNILDSLLATADTPLPAARVQLLHVDSASRHALSAHGITADAPSGAYLLARPYGGDCRTIRWTDTRAWTQPGDTGYVVATLVPREFWIGGLPTLVIPDAWNYPYPRQQGLLSFPPSVPPFADAATLFDLDTTAARVERRAPAESAGSALFRDAMLAWARAHVEQRDREPVRHRVREAMLTPDFERVQQMPSRLRGTYRVRMLRGDTVATWWFRSVDKPSYRWTNADTSRTTSDIVESPHVAGYQLLAYAMDSGAAPVVPNVRDVAAPRPTLVWLSVGDRPTRAGNDTMRTFAAELMFLRKAAPRDMWDALDPYVPPPTAWEQSLQARIPALVLSPLPRDNEQPRIPLMVQIDARGRIRADTTLRRNGARLRVTLERMDSVAMKRPF